MCELVNGSSILILRLLIQARVNARRVTSEHGLVKIQLRFAKLSLMPFVVGKDYIASCHENVCLIWAAGGRVTFKYECIDLVRASSSPKSRC